MPWLAIALGGAVGSVLRYAIGLALGGASTTFPVNTLLINVAGSFVLGAVLAALPGPPTALRLALATGFCGGFTTFSAFSAELVALGQSGAAARAGAYAALSLVLGVAAIVAGAALGRALTTAR